MRSEDLDPSSAASGLRSGSRRGRIAAAVTGAITITVGGAIGLISTASPASAATITETFAGHGPTGPLELQISESITQPANVAAGQKVSISVAGSSQAVPTAQSGVPVNYIAGLQTLIPVPANSSFVSGSIVAGTWTFKPASGTATTGPLTVTECTGAGTGCTATAPSSTFLGPGTSTPYLEASTGTSTFPAGGTLTLPAWSFDVTAGSTGSIVSTVSEFDTSANITLGTTALSIALATYPAAVVSGCLATPAVCTAQPAYHLQPIATTTIGTSTGTSTTTTSTPGSTTTAPGSTTTTTVSGSGTAGSGSGSGTGTASSGISGTGASAATGTGGALAFTGPPKHLWILGLIALALLDLGYVFLSSTWRSRRTRKSTSS